MKNSLLSLLIFIPFLLSAQLKPGLDYYLAPVLAGKNMSYKANVPTPAQYLGYEVGEWHVSHDQLVGYMRELLRTSPRVQWREYGKSHEGRPLFCLVISTPENLSRLDYIQKSHAALADPGADTDPAALPAVVYLGYSIHGNEASGSNAALVVAYHLAAAQSPQLEDFLKQTVILLDPCFNPDGLQRFASWVNSRRSRNGSADPLGDEFNEPWPRGRYNHYWFDLNRDWLAATQPESPGRVRLLHEWKPNVLTDHHEMGPNSTFFFQPGVPSRVNPLTPKMNQTLTAKIGNYHARVLSEYGIPFFTGEGYDDFYTGKGSTFPDINGCIGILFEQASSRGSAQETANGLLTFPYTIRNHVFTSFSTLEAVGNMRVELNTYLRDFYKDALQNAQRSPVGAYIFDAAGHDQRGRDFLALLALHDIEVRPLGMDVRLGGKEFQAAQSYIIPLAQPQATVILSLFERRTQFADSIFYDISAWNLADAFGLQWAGVPASEFNVRMVGKTASSPVQQATNTSLIAPFGFAVAPDAYETPALIGRLWRDQVPIKIAVEPFSSNGKLWPAGTLLVFPHSGNLPADTLAARFRRATSAPIWANRIGMISSALTETGPDLGSSKIVAVPPVRVMLITGEGIDPLDAGEAWHVLDVRYGLPVTQVDASRLSQARLNEYQTLILPDGNYRNLLSADKVREFVLQGGTVVASGGALRWLSKLGLAPIKFRGDVSRESLRRAYSLIQPDAGALNLPGAIFETDIDRTHPLCFGYNQNNLPYFLGDTLFVELPKNPYAAPVVFTHEPLLAGYLHEKHKKSVSGAAAVAVYGLGKGRIVCFAGSPNFRGFWYGTNRLFANAVQFGGLIQPDTVEKP